MKHISYITYKTITNGKRFNNATSGGDNSVDPNPVSSPASFLAPMVGPKPIYASIGLVIGVLVIIYLATLIGKNISK